MRETFYAYGRWVTRYSEKKKRDEWHFIDMTLESGRKYLFAADNDNYAADLGANQGRGVYPAWWKRPAIFMPRAVSRITLQITDVRVERLQSISEADAREEGCGFLLPEYPQWDGDPNLYRKLFRVLWESINGAGSWPANPWVWCVSFRRVGLEAA